MGLNVKNEETCRLARTLARLTGETMTEAITIALRERLERENSRRSSETLARELHAIGQCCSRLIAPGPAATNHGDLLYDDRGLPK
ncbi:MAG: type II toxin-antitoxin system VapB family antitoxin [Candidatus Aminicenantes bacterium]|nr:type II toxin-antitoxin system VapB family antitoxin [Candidatus Aminicenantes bacterium]